LGRQQLNLEDAQVLFEGCKNKLVTLKKIMKKETHLLVQAWIITASVLGYVIIELLDRLRVW
jgi:hypothetical protein